MIEAASFHLTGLPAVLLILAILALIVLGLVTVVRSIKRRATK